MRRLRSLSLVMALLAAGSPACSRRSVPVVVVGLDSVSPLGYLSGDGDVEMDEGVAEAGTVVQAWGAKHQDVYAGVIYRPEAAYVGLTRDHARILKDLQAQVKRPELLRAFRARYSETELMRIASEVDNFMFEEFRSYQDDVGAGPATAMNRVLIEVNFPSPELVSALWKRFGKRIFIYDSLGNFKRACSSPPGPCD